jgi:hypothetical protein
MHPPKWLLEFWAENPSWIRRYQQSSADVNRLLCGISVRDTPWNKANVKKFLAWSKSVVSVLKKPVTLYRGTSVESPTMAPLGPEITSCQFISTSTSRAIAKEFSWPRGSGFLHILKCEPGVRFYNVSLDPSPDNPAVREKEILLYPGTRLRLLGRRGATLTWQCY